MKKILVPIDFSDCAYNALEYAVNLSKKLKASIYVCHALNDADSLHNNSIRFKDQVNNNVNDEIELTIKNLKNKHIQFDNLYYNIKVGTVKNVVKELVDELKIDLVVMGLAGASNLVQLIIGSNSKAVIENTNIPVLLIPRKAAFKHPKKIGFATILSNNDINPVHQLARLFCHFESDILLSNISLINDPIDEHKKKVNYFLSLITDKINYSKIYYRQINEKRIDIGLKWLVDNAQIDILAMVYRNKKLYQTIFEPNLTKEMADYVRLPLLMLPE